MEDLTQKLPLGAALNDLSEGASPSGLSCGHSLPFMFCSLLFPLAPQETLKSGPTERGNLYEKIRSVAQILVQV